MRTGFGVDFRICGLGVWRYLKRQYGNAALFYCMLQTIGYKYGNLHWKRGRWLE